MKTIILVLVGFLVGIYMLLIEVNLYSIENHRNQLANNYARVMEQTLEEAYITKDETAVQQILEQKLEECLGEHVEFQVNLQCVNLGQGILCASITEEIPLITGKKKFITLEKTVIMDRKVVIEPTVTVTFQVGEIVYKEYQLVVGEECPCPLPPSENFVGWKIYGSDYLITDDIGKVWEDRMYIAVME